MKRSILLLCMLALFLFSGLTNASNLTKLNASLRFRLKQIENNPQLKKELSQQKMRVFIQGIDLTSIVDSQGGQTGAVFAGWTTATIPVNSIYHLMEEERIQRIKMAPKVYFRNDQVVERTRAKWVQEGQSPLSSSYTGKGVIVGIIDSGIDVGHPDFQNADGSTRILYLWDQNVDLANSPPEAEGYDYGQEWAQSQINDGLCTHEDVDGHGTHVSGTAAGNGRAVNNYKGTAPESDLIVVAISPFSSSFVDAANYIYQKADELGKPCVINASLGWHSTYHDGTDADALMIDSMIDAKPGRLFCAAAGNEGSDMIHLTPQATSDEKWTYYFPGPDGIIQLSVRIPNDFLQITSFAVGVDESNINPEYEEGGSITYKGKTDWYTAKQILDDSDQGIYKNLKFDSELGGRVSYEAELITDSTTGLIITIEEDNFSWDQETGEVSDLELWRLYIKNGNPRIDIWLADLGYPFWDFPNTTEYLEPDNRKSVGMPAVAHKMIAVGASVNRNEFTNKEGTVLGTSSTPGDLAAFSSLGPSADNRIKPDIVAPGENVISALSQPAYNEGNIYDEDIVAGEKHFIASGTSMSSPAAAGCIALYLEKYPEANFNQVLTALKSSAQSDSYTGNYLPNNTWGHGKIDIHKMIQSTHIQNCKIREMEFSLFDNYPNPFNPSTIISYQLSVISDVQLDVYNLSGQHVSHLVSEKQAAGSYQVEFNGSALPSGIYFYRLSCKDFTEKRKMLLMK